MTEERLQRCLVLARRFMDQSKTVESIKLYKIVVELAHELAKTQNLTVQLYGCVVEPDVVVEGES